jgi:hypothetical protein
MIVSVDCKIWNLCYQALNCSLGNEHKNLEQKCSLKNKECWDSLAHNSRLKEMGMIRGVIIIW